VRQPIRSFAMTSVCLLALGFLAWPLGSAAAQDAAPDDDVKKAEAALAHEDPSKIIEQADPATMKPSPDPAVSKQANGMWLDKDGNPTPHIGKDGTVDWFTFSGYRRYGANCLVCHGPDGLGSSYAPALADSLKTLSYPDFLGTVAAGKRDVSASSTLVMPSFATNKNVQCYVNDIYVYLRARATGQLDRQPPAKHEDKQKVYTDTETDCLGF
jgi:methanol metabolism-related c-type cytochrome